ncbi:MAG TPA: nucleoside monophosphate kinase [Candidatus Saccharimonadales bacterium]
MILFFGPPGSGKSVQGKLLVQRNGWQWLSTGELFRATKNAEVLKRLATGELMDDALTNQVLEEALGGLRDAADLVLDGYPRNTRQAQWLTDHLAAFKRKIDTIVVFRVPEEELVRRQSGRGRDEDTPDVIKRRLQIYREQTQPVIDFYRNRGVPVREIDGEGPVDVVHARIQAVVAPQRAAEQEEVQP